MTTAFATNASVPFWLGGRYIRMFQAAIQISYRQIVSASIAESARWTIIPAARRRLVYGIPPYSELRTRTSSCEPCVPNLVFTGNRRRHFATMSEQQSWWSGRTPSPPRNAGDLNFESKPMEIPAETSSEADHLLTRRVHILGLGSIGTLVAHSLKCLPNAPPITLLMHRPEMYDSFKESGRIIRLVNPKTQVNDEQRGYDVDVLEVDGETQLPHWKHIPDTPERNKPATNPVSESEMMDSGEVFIYTLIVSVKGPATINALSSVKHRVNSSTTICLMQNGMGQIDELNEKVFTDPETRPTYMLGIVTHGAYMQGRFTVIHAGFGSTALGIWRDTDKYPLPPKSIALDAAEMSEDERKQMYPSDTDLYSNLSSRYLLRTLTRSPVLTCAPFPYVDLMQLQLEKLAMNAILNPLTALLNVSNGSILGPVQLNRVQRLLLAEISLVIRGLPELESIPGVKLRFSANRLENMLIAITRLTAKNSSSMREDLRNLRETEIEYINGYIVRRGEEQGIKCVLNFMLMQLVQAKSLYARSESRQSYEPSTITAEKAFGDNVVVLEGAEPN